MGQIGEEASLLAAEAGGAEGEQMAASGQQTAESASTRGRGVLERPECGRDEGAGRASAAATRARKHAEGECERGWRAGQPPALAAADAPPPDRVLVMGGKEYC